MQFMQDTVEFIFNEVWCKAPNVEYSLSLYKQNEFLYQIIDEFFRLDQAEKLENGSGKDFYTNINEIFNQFKKLNKTEIAALIQQFISNNEIESLCKGDAHTEPTTYSDLDPNLKKLNEKLENFFKNLYSSNFFNLKVVKNHINASLKGYYKSFVKENDECVCPFCGLIPTDSEFDPSREAFDHYLPKSKYSFNSVNLKNLAPSCGKCNSSNKRDQDPIHNKKQERRKAFYPFSKDQSDLEISISFQKPDWNNLQPENIEIKIKSKNHQEEADTWEELYKIKERYSARCCNKAGGKDWMNRVLIENQNYNLSSEKMIEAEIKSTAKSPWINANFLKRIFLEEFSSSGIKDLETYR